MARFVIDERIKKNLQLDGIKELEAKALAKEAAHQKELDCIFDALDGCDFVVGGTNFGRHVNVETCYQTDAHGRLDLHVYIREDDFALTDFAFFHDCAKDRYQDDKLIDDAMCKAEAEIGWQRTGDNLWVVVNAENIVDYIIKYITMFNDYEF